MKFIAFLDCDVADLEKFIEIWEKRISTRHTIKTIFPPHTMANSPKGYSGFTIFETDCIEDIMHYVTEYGLVAGVEVIPIWESSEGAKLYQKIKAGL